MTVLKKVPVFYFLKIFIYFADIRIILFFNIISFILDTFSPAISSPLNVIGKKRVLLGHEDFRVPVLSHRHHLQFHDPLKRS
jgi:hypothetical protein